jgi:LAO/AO transport system kinase
VIATIATKGSGFDQLTEYITKHVYQTDTKNEKLLAEKAWTLIQKKLMSKIDRKSLQEKLMKSSQERDFNLYRFVEKYLKSS